MWSGWGEGTHTWERGRELSPDPGQLWGLSWSGGLHLSAPGGLSLSSFCLSLSVQLDVQELHNPPPHRSRPALPGHAWPSLGIHSGCFLFAVCTHLLSICHSRPYPAKHLHVSTLFVKLSLNALYIFLSYAPSNYSPQLYTLWHLKLSRTIMTTNGFCWSFLTTSLTHLVMLICQNE